MEDPAKNSRRPIDSDVAAARQAMRSRFSYVTKARGNVWMTAGVTLFILGLVSAAVLVNYGGSGTGTEAAGLKDRFTAPGIHIAGPDAVESGQANAYVLTATRLKATSSPLNFHVDWGDGSAAQDAAADSATGQATVQHSYAQVGTFSMSVSSNLTVPTAKLEVKVSGGQSAPGAADNSLVVALSDSSPPAHTVEHGAADESFLAIDVKTQTEVTVKSIQIISDIAGARRLGSVKVYAGATLLGSGLFNEQVSGTANLTARISLGAGLTIPANATTTLTIKADMLEDVAAGQMRLGLSDVTTQPASSIQSTLPIYGSFMTVLPAKPDGQIKTGPILQP